MFCFFYTDKQHDVIFTIYAPTVFATLRAALGISHEDFLMVRSTATKNILLLYVLLQWSYLDQKVEKNPKITYII